MQAIRSGKVLRGILGMFLLVIAGASAKGDLPLEDANDTTTAASSTGIGALPVGAMIRPAAAETPDACAQSVVAANGTRPAWDYAASTTQCGILESDYGLLDQPMGGGVGQRALVTSLRYGLTPKLDLRWGITNHIWQGGGAAGPLQGVGDQWLGMRFRFRDQGRIAPAMAFLYAGKIPEANPAKGFGSGFVDHQFVFIASRDLGKNHFDFNTVGTVAGVAHGHNGAAQFGLAYTRPVSAKLSCILESYGGAQPGTPDRLGAVFAGATYTLRPQLVLDGAFSRSYTAGSPRQQVLVGITYARRAGFSTLPRTSAFARALGR
jgi:hypothetical protein